MIIIGKLCQTLRSTDIFWTKQGILLVSPVSESRLIKLVFFQSDRSRKRVVCGGSKDEWFVAREEKQESELIKKSIF